MANAGNIRAWLAELGLAKYAEAFASNDIDLDVLPELTDADLKDLGVASLGDRKRLLKAISSMAAPKVPKGAPAKLQAELVHNPTSPSMRSGGSARQSDAERRQL